MVSSRSRPSSSSRPCCGRRRPATRRSKEDLPTPLGPVTSSASPAPTVKLKARKTCRPPLTQARSDPTSRITCRPPARVVAEAIIPAAIQPPSDLHWPRLWSGQGAEKSLILCPCRWQVSIFWNGAKKDPISHRPAPTINPRWTRDRGPGEALSVVCYRRAASLPVGWDPTTMTSIDSFRSCKPLKVGSKTYAYYSLAAAEKNGLKSISRLPFSMKVLLENLLRNEDGRSITKEDIQAVAQWLKTKTSEREIAFRPARVLMQDFTGVPAVVDLAAMRDAMKMLGGDPKKINPLVPVDLVCDHSVAVTFFGSNNAVKRNVEEEYRQNRERYEFLKWSQKSFDNFRVVPPGTGICHQVNLEYLSQTVWSKKDKVKIDGKPVVIDVAYPDTLVGTDSHTTMVNGLAVLGWGVGGIEAEAAMLGQPYSMLLPEVIGVKLTGKLKEGVTATDLVLTVTQMLRKRGVVGKFVEYFGPGLANLSIADRATIGNMSPEYGATCGFFPVDDETIRYLRETGRPDGRIALVAAYAKAQGLYLTKNTPDPVFTDVLKLDLASIEPSMAGPKRPQDRVLLKEAASGFV